MLPKEAIEEFKKLYKKIFKERLSDKDASEVANKFYNLWRLEFQSKIKELNKFKNK